MNKKITVLEMCSLAWQLILSSAIGIATYVAFFSVKQDAWISVILSGILGLIPLSIYLYLMNYRKDLNFFELNEYLFGKVLGKIINTIIIIVVALCVIIYFFNLTNFISSQYLNKTNNLLIIIVLIIPVIYLLLQDLKVIGRTTFILFIFSLVLLFFSIIGLVGQVDLNNIKPIMENKLFNIFITSGKLICYMVFQLILLLSIPKSNILNNKKFEKSILITYFLVYIIATLVIFIIISVLGSNLALIYQYPEFHVLKRISIGGFIERVENTLSLRWIFYMFTIVVFGLYFIKNYITVTFNIQDKVKIKIIISFISLVILMLSNWIFKNNTEGNYVLLNVLPIILYSTIFLTIIAMLIKTKTKKN